MANYRPTTHPPAQHPTSQPRPPGYPQGPRQPDAPQGPPPPRYPREPQPPAYPPAPRPPGYAPAPRPPAPPQGPPQPPWQPGAPRDPRPSGYPPDPREPSGPRDPRDPRPPGPPRGPRQPGYPGGSEPPNHGPGPRQPIYPQGPRPRRGPRWGVMVAIGLIGLLLSGGGGALAYFLPALTAAVNSTGQSVGGQAQGARPANPAAPLAPSAPFTVLFLGSDNDSKFKSDQLLTQSMILVRVDPVAKHVTMLSIPRDLYVPISNGGSNKIDTAYIRGGAATAMATVSRDFQVRIDDYVWIGLQGLVKLIDLVGGVDVTATAPVMDDFYPADVTSDNAYGYERVAVLAGPQHLDGVHAMEYVRSRHSDLQGDVGRSKRQQAVLLALRAKSKYLNASDVPDLAATFNGQFKTSIPLSRIRSLLPLAQALSDPTQVKQVFLDGSPYYSSVTLPAPVGDALRPNWNAIIPLVHQDFPA